MGADYFWKFVRDAQIYGNQFGLIIFAPHLGRLRMAASARVGAEFGQKDRLAGMTIAKRRQLLLKDRFSLL